MIWAHDAARFFFDQLSDKDRAKVLSLFQRLGDHGRISNKEKFKSLTGTDLWEFKSFQIRFLGSFRPRGRFVIALGMRKKKDRHSRSDLEKAARILAEYDSQ